VQLLGKFAINAVKPFRNGTFPAMGRFINYANTSAGKLDWQVPVRLKLYSND
jgi:hypothetical protein